MKVCKKFLEQNVKYKDFAASLGISEMSLRNWVRKYNNFGESAFSNSKLSQEEIIKELQKENKRLKRKIEEQEIRDEMLADLRRLISEKK